MLKNGANPWQKKNMIAKYAPRNINYPSPTMDHLFHSLFIIHKRKFNEHYYLHLKILCGILQSLSIFALKMTFLPQLNWKREKKKNFVFSRANKNVTKFNKQTVHTNLRNDPEGQRLEPNGIIKNWLLTLFDSVVSMKMLCDRIIENNYNVNWIGIARGVCCWNLIHNLFWLFGIFDELR